MKVEDLTLGENALAKHYNDFNVTGRVLLTGHSHQAWPDVAWKGMSDYWTDARTYVDDKWAHAFAKADEVRRGYAEIMQDTTGSYTLASNTHDLVIRLISAMDLKNKPKIITTDGEFHTLRRQLARLSEAGIELIKVDSEKPDDVVENVIRQLDNKTSLVAISKVMFKTAAIVPNLGLLAAKCEEMGITLLIDAYHALNAMPFTIEQEQIDSAFIVGGGYKYCQLGEGNCFLRVPPGCEMRPVITGWFSEFALVANVNHGSEVPYGENEARFAGSTYDPVSNYRATAVFKFFREHNLTPDFLREVNLAQLHYMADKFDLLDLNPNVISRDKSIRLKDKAAFMVLKTPHAGHITSALREKGVYVDFRGDNLRLGPAPYINFKALDEAILHLKEVTNKL